MVQQNENNRIAEKCLLVVVAMSVLLALRLYAFINLRNFTGYCDSDMYADTMLAKWMWEGKTLFPQGWVFGNQFYIFATPVLCALIYPLTNDVNTAMALATECMTGLLLVSFARMLRGFNLKRLEIATGCLMLLTVIPAPEQIYSESAQLFFTMASYYACYLLTMFVVFYDYIRAHYGEKTSWSWGAALFLSFAMGMQSLRQTVVMIFPILICEGFLAIQRFWHHRKMWDSDNRGGLFHAASYAVANGAGVLLIQYLQIPSHTIYGKVTFSMNSDWSEKWRMLWDAFKKITLLDFVLEEGGFNYFTIVCLASLLVVVAALVIWLIKMCKGLTAGLEIGWLLWAISLIGVFATGIVMEISIRSVYLFSWFPLVVLSILMVVRAFRGKMRYVIILLACFMGLGNLYHSYLPAADIYITQYGAVRDARQMCQWAEEEGYQWVYGQWMTSPRIAVHSGGRLMAFCWEYNAFEAVPYLNRIDMYTEENNDKALYVFREDEEEMCLQKAGELGAKLEKVAEFGTYRAYVSDCQLMHIPDT